MRRLTRRLAIALFCFFVVGNTYGQAQKNYLIEAEDFQFPGAWTFGKEAGTTVSGKGALLGASASAEPTSDAFTVIKIAAKGNYFVWTKSRDYAENKPGTRKYLLICNDEPMKIESGAHLQEGYRWEKVGRANLNEGDNVLRLKNTKLNYARCDAIFFTADESFDPNDKAKSLQSYYLKPTQVEENHAKLSVALPIRFLKKTKVLGTLANDKLKLTVQEILETETNKKHIVVVSEIFKENRWVSISQNIEENRIFLLKAKKPKIEFGPFYALWKNAVSLSTFSANGKSYQVLDQNGAKNPFLSGDLLLCKPIAVTQLSKQEIEITYLTEDGNEVKGSWKLNPESANYELSLSYSAKEDGFYSFVVGAFQSIAKNAVGSVQLPPMFNYKRIPEEPLLVPSAMTPQPIAIVEATNTGKPISLFITGAPAEFPLDWAKDVTSYMGFSLKNELNEVQPVAFSPILGLADSKLNAGATLKRKFNIGAVVGNWNDALAYISSNIYQVKDYRLQDATSLTNAAFNIIDLIKNDDASGWDAKLKGFYDIEADPKVAPTVAQSSPLAVISAAVLAKDEDFYLTRALPTIEYTLSRSAFRWAKAVGAPYNTTAQSLELNPYKNVQFNTAYFESLHQLLGQKNPWLLQVAMPNKQPRKTSGYSVNIPAWTQELAAYRLTKDKKWLNDAVSHAKEFVANDVYGTKTNLLTAQPFYNTSFYPYWWDLMDLYELTKDVSFMKAAEYSSFFTIAGIRSYPLVEDKLQRIHQGDQFEGNTNLWWKNGDKFRLGFPRSAGDVKEKEVPQSLISPVGVGLEQPVTFFLPNKNVRHIFMSTWAPHLLRMAEHSKRDIFEIYARNSIIGRFSGYPGYYATGFTDLTYQANYPYKGPDINSIYYHHISPHLAFTLDFLVTEAVQRSQGRISFPWGKQEGFVWFNNRIYGGGKGTIFDDANANLWLKKGLVTIDNPEINYLTAVSKDRFWLILLNESSKQQQFDVALNTNEIGINNAGVKLYRGQSTEPANDLTSDHKIKANIAAKGLVAYSFPLKENAVKKELLPIKEGIKEVNLGAPWGTLYAFRIRSPFGWDSIYTYLSTSPLIGAEAELIFNDNIADAKKCTSYPYEWSFSKIDPNQPISISLNLKNKGSDEVRQVHLTLDGIKP
ncbi:hypothetical protein D3C87_183120 [compost metagenome]